jgi:peptidoglycan/LPS O-acetylase OafA/YrhL
MHYEMIGSLLVFAVLLCFRRIRYAMPLLLAAAGGLTIANEGFPNYACFLVGICISAARADGVFNQIQNFRWSQPLSWLAFVAVAGASGAVHSMGLLNDQTIIFAVPLLLIIFCNRPLIQFFSSRISRFLGSISFPIYLLQFPVIATFTAGQIAKAVNAGGLSVVAIWYIGLTSLVICVVAATAFLPVEALTRRVGNRIAGVLIKPEDLATASTTFWDVDAPSPRGAEFIQS